jgi:hypothetical protein
MLRVVQHVTTYSAFFRSGITIHLRVLARFENIAMSVGDYNEGEIKIKPSKRGTLMKRGWHDVTNEGAVFLYVHDKWRINLVAMLFHFPVFLLDHVQSSEQLAVLPLSPTYLAFNYFPLSITDPPLS